ncbi:MAG: protein translocase subunit SecF [Nanoarchaeota archaeon]|nr:protein translocase subunit SecF [Nanoarchaeota archaeon]
MELQNTKNWYDKVYKIALILPIIALIFSIFYLYNFTQKTGDIISKDVTLTGGTTITVFGEDADLKKIQADLKTEFPDLRVREISDILTGKSSGFSLTTKAEVDKIKPALETSLGYALTDENSSIEFSGASLSSGFYAQLKYALILSFILMAIVVFAIFRDFVPSFIVVLAAFADIVMTIAVVNLLGIQLSSAGIIAFLMLIGYSVDTDILLTTRLIRKTAGGSVNQRIYDAFKTGMTMTLTSIAAIAVSLILIYNFSGALRQIFTILLIGLGFDIFNTWISNASLLKWHMEAKKK